MPRDVEAADKLCAALPICCAQLLGTCVQSECRTGCQYIEVSRLKARCFGRQHPEWFVCKPVTCDLFVCPFIYPCTLAEINRTYNSQPCWSNTSEKTRDSGSDVQMNTAEIRRPEHEISA